MARALLGPTVGKAVSQRVDANANPDLVLLQTELESPAFLSAIRGMSIALDSLPWPPRGGRNPKEVRMSITVTNGWESSIYLEW